MPSLPCGYVVGFVNDDDVPVRVFQIMPVLNILLECIDGNNRTVEMMKRIVIAGNTMTHPLQALRIQARQTNGKAAPEFLLKLTKHGLDRQHQYALSPTSRYQLTR